MESISRSFILFILFYLFFIFIFSFVEKSLLFGVKIFFSRFVLKNK